MPLSHVPCTLGWESLCCLNFCPKQAHAPVGAEGHLCVMKDLQVAVNVQSAAWSLLNMLSML